MGWCLLRGVGGLRRGGWVWLFPCSAEVQLLLSQRYFSSCFPNRNWGLHLEIGVLEGEGSSPWGRQTTGHARGCPGRLITLSVPCLDPA